MTYPHPAHRIPQNASRPSWSPAAGGLGVLARQAGRFGAVGTAATGLQLVSFAAFSLLVGSQVANAGAWLLSTFAATAGHRRWSFRTADVRSAARDHAAGLTTGATGLLATALTLAAVGTEAQTGSTGALVVLSVNIVVGVARFAVLRWWFTPSHSNRRVPAATGNRSAGRAMTLIPRQRSAPVPAMAAAC